MGKGGEVRRALIVGGSPEAPAPALLARLAREADAVVACDRGADACLAAGVRVDALVGDNDSLSVAALRSARSGGAVERGFPMDKDRVDLRLAFDVARGLYPSLARVTLTSVSGGRPDHALAVFGVLAREAALAPRVEENAFELRTLSPLGEATWQLGVSDVGRTLSVIAPLPGAVVSEEGMRWNLERAELEPLGDLGVSNVVERTPARVEVHRGAVFAILLRERIEKRVTTC